MAIEFQCPHCSAAIRVPDAAGGKQGKCPSCGQRLLVPKVEIPPEPPPAAVPEPPPAEVNLPFPAVAEASPGAAGSPLVSVGEPQPAVAAGIPEGLPFPAAAVEPTDPFSPDALPYVVSRKKKKGYPARPRRRKKQKLGVVEWLMIGFGVAVLLISAFVGWRYYETHKPPPAHYQAQALASDFAPPPQRLLPGDYGVDEAVSDAVLSALRDHTESLISDRMRMRFRADEKKGMEITLESGEASQFVLFHPRSEPNLAAYCTSKVLEFDAIRKQELTAAAKSFFAAYQAAREAKTPMGQALAAYRDSVGLTAMSGGLGYVVEAQSGSIVSRCVYEDGDGRLYFLLPQGATSFQLRGRKLVSGKTPFEGVYTVSVTPAPKVEAKEKPGKEDEEKMEEEEDGLAPKTKPKGKAKPSDEKPMMEKTSPETAS